MNANVPTRTGRASTQRRVGPLLLALSAVLLVVTAPASAGPRYDTCSYGKCNQRAHAGPHYNLPEYGVHVCAAHRAYLRGFDQGYDEGRSQGYSDGYYGAYFDDRLPRRLRRRPPDFVEGFVNGYTQGYELSYQRGKNARWNSRRSRASRWRCWG